jgi:NAD(P)H-quinone oxidoreductase subunit 5
MTNQDTTRTVGSLPKPDGAASLVPAACTRLVWALWVASVGVLAARLVTGSTWTLPGVAAIDGLTALLWVVVTFFGGIVASYSRRYLAGSTHQDRFFVRIVAFTLVVMALVAAEHVLLFAAAWLAMGLVMASLIGVIKGWPQARAAGALARNYFLASSGLLAVALGVLWWTTGATTVSGITASAGTVPESAALVAVGALVLAAMIQSALLPFHTWLLSSMTAPTPASALMHAGFVNAGGILLTRFAPVVSLDASVMVVIVLVGASSALAGKLLKSVQTDIKGQLGCSTVGQMGFMIMQVGLGFFSAAVTHLILHGCYKAYQFLSSGEAVEHTAPKTGADDAPGALGWVVTGLSAVAGGAVFALLTGKGTGFDSGLLLTGLVVVTMLHASKTVLAETTLPATVRVGAIPLVLLPAVAVYGVAYTAIESLVAVSMPAELTVVHGIVGVAFVVAYVAIETDAYRHSERLYVAMLNATQPASETLLTTREDYNEY